MRRMLIVGCLQLAACVSISDVMPMADGNYFLQAEDSMLSLRGRNTVMEDAMERATEFCGKQSKVALLVSQDSKGAVLWTATASGIVFRCVAQESKPVVQ